MCLVGRYITEQITCEGTWSAVKLENPIRTLVSASFEPSCRHSSAKAGSQGGVDANSPSLPASSTYGLSQVQHPEKPR